eukprot:TRINITY_DN217_c0_g1_i1.p1 TRINITY_DN217_c0_g1~~TRINITY_DN217_c0_g1_i1.p1  ORF type:complete len:733 (-),score=188.95 TRINITY_DN217_c0_g1_i1:215-2413(-)
MASLVSKLSSANETTWMRIGSMSELMHDPDKAMMSYDNALRHNPYNVKALTQIASICRMREQYPKAVEYFQRILNIENNNGEIWGALGHCYLMMDDLQKAYTAYQQALYHLPNPKDPNLWYGIGILYDRYGSFEHAEEAFTAVLKMDGKFEKSNEIYFRLGIIYKQQMKYEQALDCFRFILSRPPRPLTQGDIWFQIGHVQELQKEFNLAKDAYEKVLKETPNHAKALQQLGWLYHSSMSNQEVAITYLLRSIDADQTDGQTWYLLGRCYMAQQQYRKAYDAYQQAVYRDGRNPTFWCSIGVLYYQINQYRDALDAYSRAIRLNPYLSEVWYDLGTLYESCNQMSDSLDAYQRAAELDPGNKHIQQRLSALRESQVNNKNGASIDIEAKEKGTPMTLEPRASHMAGAEPRTRVATQNVLTVPDLVDLSNDEKRTLPSAVEMKNSPSDHPHMGRHSISRDPPTPTSDSKDRDKERLHAFAEHSKTFEAENRLPAMHKSPTALTEEPKKEEPRRNEITLTKDQPEGRDSRDPVRELHSAQESARDAIREYQSQMSELRSEEVSSSEGSKVPSPDKMVEEAKPQDEDKKEDTAMEEGEIESTPSQEESKAQDKSQVSPHTESPGASQKSDKDSPQENTAQPEKKATEHRGSDRDRESRDKDHHHSRDRDSKDRDRERDRDHREHRDRDRSDRDSREGRHDKGRDKRDSRDRDDRDRRDRRDSESHESRDDKKRKV